MKRNHWLLLILAIALIGCSKQDPSIVVELRLIKDRPDLEENFPDIYRDMKQDGYRVLTPMDGYFYNTVLSKDEPIGKKSAHKRFLIGTADCIAILDDEYEPVHNIPFCVHSVGNVISLSIGPNKLTIERQGICLVPVMREGIQSTLLISPIVH